MIKAVLSIAAFFASLPAIQAAPSAELIQFCKQQTETSYIHCLVTEGRDIRDKK